MQESDTIDFDEGAFIRVRFERSCASLSSAFSFMPLLHIAQPPPGRAWYLL